MLDIWREQVLYSFCKAILRLFDAFMHVFWSCLEGRLCFSKWSSVCVCVYCMLNFLKGKLPTWHDIYLMMEHAIEVIPACKSLQVPWKVQGPGSYLLPEINTDDVHGEATHEWYFNLPEVKRNNNEVPLGWGCSVRKDVLFRHRDLFRGHGSKMLTLVLFVLQL